MKVLIAIPVYNEAQCLGDVLRATLRHGHDVLVVDDGSTDTTPAVLKSFTEIAVVRHQPNRGYGASLRTAFDYACQRDYDLVITLDSDGQHEPALIPDFVTAGYQVDIVSGSRYLREFVHDSPAPIERRRINRLVTDQLNACLGLHLTDSFCGFKAYRTEALRRLELREAGYGMPLELWVQAAAWGMSIREVAVPRLYLDPNRSFGENLDDACRRLEYYQEVIDQAVANLQPDAVCTRTLRRPVLRCVDG